jgi:hemerythrin-like metal-binding protein
MSQPLFIKWHERNETGIEIIDEQHKGIVSIINTFYYLMGLGTYGSMLYSCISDTMKNYSRIHFITEEGLLEASGYEHIEKHKKLHKNLLLEIERIEYDVIKNNDPKPLLDFLKKWWIEHINEKDQLYAPHLRAHGNVRHAHRAT